MIPIATQTAANFDAFLKNVYRGPIVELLNQECYLIERVQGTNVNDLGTFRGRQLIFAVHTSRNRGRNWTTDGGTLATAGRQGGLDGIVTIKTFDQGIELTDLVIQQSKQDEGAFTRAMDYEMTMATTDMKKDVCRAGYGTGDGLLASILGTPNGTSITVDSGQYIAVGDTIDILVKSTGATTNGIVASSVTAVAFTGTAGSSTQANATLTIAPGTAGALDTTYGVYVTGDRANETDGLRNICNTGRILFQINSSTNPVWDSNVLAGGWVNANEDLFMRIAQTIRQRSGKSINGFLTSLGVQRRLANTYVSQKRWNDDRATQIEGGYEAINISAGGKTIPVIADVDAVNGAAFAINDDSFAWAEINRPDWLIAPDERGSIFMLKDGATAGQKVSVWQAFLVWYATLVNVAPLRNGQITQLNDDIPIGRL